MGRFYDGGQIVEWLVDSAGVWTRILGSGNITIYLPLPDGYFLPSSDDFNVPLVTKTTKNFSSWHNTIDLGEWYSYSLNNCQPTVRVCLGFMNHNVRGHGTVSILQETGMSPIFRSINNWKNSDQHFHPFALLCQESWLGSKKSRPGPSHNMRFLLFRVFYNIYSRKIIMSQLFYFFDIAMGRQLLTFLFYFCP